MTQEEIYKVFANPFYTIRVDEIFTVPHKFLIAREEWINVNVRAIEEIGTRKWLEYLLDNLKGGYPK